MTRKILPLPSQARLHELLDFDPLTGVFVWRMSRGTVRAGGRAGWFHSTGYWYVRVDGVDYKLHRLAWVWVHGSAPQALIDHIDRNKSNNAIDNLREATHAQNQQNKKTYANNLSGHKGVSWYPLRSKWRVRIQHDKRSILVGFFSTLTEAVQARRSTEAVLHTHANFLKKEL
jgi:hypothetical protein